MRLTLTLALVALLSACGTPLPNDEPACIPASELGCVGDNCDRLFPVCADGYRAACAPETRFECADPDPRFLECDPEEGLLCPSGCQARCVAIGDAG